MIDRVTAFAPATVSNVGCGFDVLGFALEEPGDAVTAIARPRPGVDIVEITGDQGRLPRQADRNTASVAAAALLRESGVPTGVDLVVRKGLPLASGLGSSAASAVAAVRAVDALLHLDAPPTVLLRCAMEGERVACGAMHADNVAPGLYGGFVLARAIDPPDIIELPVPAGLACVVLQPAWEIETRAARAVLPADVPLRDAIRQWANVGALVAALYAGDFGLLGRATADHLIEPRRASLLPGFYAVRQAALDAGAIGCSFSGAGPAMFALCHPIDRAAGIGEAMRAELRRAGGLDGRAFVSRVAPHGARIVDAVA